MESLAPKGPGHRKRALVGDDVEWIPKIFRFGKLYAGASDKHFGINFHGDPVLVVREICGDGILAIEKLILGHHGLENDRAYFSDPRAYGFLASVNDLELIEFVFEKTRDKQGIVYFQF